MHVAMKMFTMSKPNGGMEFASTPDGVELICFRLLAKSFLAFVMTERQHTVGLHTHSLMG